MPSSTYKDKATRLGKEGMEQFGWKWIELNEEINQTAQKYVDITEFKIECMLKDIAFTLLTSRKL